MTDGDETSDTSLPVRLEERDSIAIIRFNRPAERNPLSTHILEQLSLIVSKLIPRKDISAIIFTGTGDVFASGADIKELRELTTRQASAFAARGQNLFRMIEDARQLTLAAINGYCMGGGLDLALACNVRIASPRALIAHPGARLGIITGWGGTQKLPRLVGQARACEIFLAGRCVPAAEAFEMGLVSCLSDDALGWALELAASFNKKGGGD